MNSSTSPSNLRDTISPALLLFLFTGFLALQPMCTDIYLPTMPALGREFHAPIHEVQWTLSIFIVGFGITQLLIGPLSDRYGRHPILMWSMALFTLSSFAAIFSHNLYFLVVCRFLQAAGTCGAILGARAMIRDLYAPAEGAKIFAIALFWMAFVPLLGPMFAGSLIQYGGFRFIFAVFTFFGAVLWWMTWRFLSETNSHKNPLATQWRMVWKNYALVARSPVFWTFTLAMSSSYAGLFTFLSASSFVLMQVLHFDAQQYGLMISLTALGYLSGSLLCRHALPKFGVQHVLYFASTLAACSGTAQLIAAWQHIDQGWLIAGIQFFFMMAHGFISPCSQAGAIAPFPRHAGAAAAFMGFVMSCIGTLIGIWIGYSFNNTTLPMAATICVCGFASVLVAQILVRRYGSLETSI